MRSDFPNDLHDARDRHDALAADPAEPLEPTDEADDAPTTPPPPPARSSTAAPVTAARDPLLGAVLLDRVRIDRPIARGGMGAVYLGEQTSLNRRCAVKVLDRRLTNGGDADEFTRRFLLEASVAARISHPNVVTIFDYGDPPEGCFIAMEYLDGRTLADELKSVGRLTFERAIHIGRQIARALREAHALGVVHRDIKPGNVFLLKRDDDEDFVKVLDFGLVHERQEVRDQPVADAIMGSPRYMAPEQVQGKEVDGRTDIYSLGVVLYAMLTGHVPFERRTELATMMAQVSDPPPPMETVVPGLVLPHGLEALVMRCLAKNPDERWRSMEELVAALQLRSGAAFAGTEAPLAPDPSHSAPVVYGAGPFDPLAQPQPALGRAPARPNRRLIAALAVASAGVALCAGIFIRPSPAAVPPVAPAAPVVTPPAPTIAALPPSTLPKLTAVVRVETDPPGAKVKEEGETICAATPCDVEYSGDAARADTEHLLAFLLPGYKIEQKIVRVPVTRSASPTKVKLTRAR